MLLQRYGIVFREPAGPRDDRSKNGASFSSPSAVWKTAGEVRGGRFVDGFLGEQFASPQPSNPCAPPANSLPAASSPPFPPPTLST